MDDRLTQILSSHKKEPSALIPVLQAAQEELGYLPKEAMSQIARYLGLSESQVFGTASFYAQFRFAPKGRREVTVCRGTACHVRGAPRVIEEVKQQLQIEEGETTPDLEYSFDTVACVGCCALGPIMVIDKKVYGRMTPSKVKKVLSK